ncbi:MAG: DUF4203 domain-containing protein [Anaerolineae bacterium]|nr:DUF4203 domain-containing protein [Anaerolineae bacterium]
MKARRMILAVLLTALAVILLAGCGPVEAALSEVFGPGRGNDWISTIRDFLAGPEAQIPLLVIGALLLFVGYWLFRFVIAVQGFLIGAAVGFVIGASIEGQFGIVSLLLVIILGLIGAGLATFLFFLGIFLSGFVAGFALASALTVSSGSDDGVLLIAIIAGIVGGIIALALHKLFVVIFTAGLGAVLINAGFAFQITLIVLLALFGFGVLVQYGLLSRFGEDHAEIPKRTA